MDKNIIAVTIAAITVVSLLICANLYTKSKERDLYEKCLRISERMLDADPKRISIPYCSR